MIKPLWNGLMNIVLHKWENNLKRKIKICSKIKLQQTWINAINLSVLQNMTLLILWLPFLVYIASPVILRILFLSPEDSFMKKPPGQSLWKSDMGCQQVFFGHTLQGFCGLEREKSPEKCPDRVLLCLSVFSLTQYGMVCRLLTSSQLFLP